MSFVNMIKIGTLSRIISVGPVEDEAQACLSALFLTDPRDDRAKLISTKGARVEGTCEWIKSHALYDLWLRSQSQLLWISGGPGKGKTMLSIFLAEELEQMARRLPSEEFLQYFCDNKDEKRNTAVAVLRGLIYQLLQLRRKLFDHILPTFKVQKESLFQFEALWRIFKSMVCDPTVETTYCVLDGLDECDEASLEMLLRKITVLLSAEPTESSVCHLNVLIVSRERPDLIPESLSGFPHISLDPDADTEITQDIDLFIKAKVKELSRRKRYPETLRVHVEEVFQHRAQGTFLWIGIVAQALEKYKLTEVEKALDSFPSGLDKLYDRILLQIDSDRREIAAKILRWVVMAVRPLTLSELGIAIETAVGPSTVAFTPDELARDQVSYCGHFLVIEVDEVSLIHQSAKDYLLRKNMASNFELEVFRVKEEAANLEIARKCLDYLQSGALDNSKSNVLCNFSHLRAFPLLSYAAVHWHEHASSLAHSEDIFDLSLPFYRKKSPIRTSWLEAYWSWDRSDWKVGRQPPDSFTLLMLASYFGILPLVEKLILTRNWVKKLKRSYNLNKTDGKGNTALMWAAKGEHEAVVGLLLDQGANTEAKDEDKRTALIVTADSGHEAIVRLLLEKGANIEAENKWERTALIEAAGLGHKAVVRLLLEKGANIEAKNGRESTALIEAAGLGHKAVVRLLLKKGADINVTDRNGKTALMIAATGDESEEAIVRLLLEKGADINAKDKDGETALMKAAVYGEGEDGEALIRLLLEEGVDINAKDKHGKTALMKAIREEKKCPAHGKWNREAAVRLLTLHSNF